MTILPNAQNLTINGGHFTDTSTTINVNDLTGIDTLLKASCPEAAHDAASREYSPRCFPGTRKQYIEDIVNWVTPTLGGNPTSIYWVKGPAGVGKSAVAQTCAEELRDRGRLGAAFFFSVTGHNKPGELFPSIAYQLSTIHPPYRDIINTKLHYDKTLVKKTMSSQFRYLIAEPLRELEAQGKGIGKRAAVIVDGLDECEGADAQCEIIRIIASAATDTELPLCWVFFSRPEPHIETTFTGTNVTPHCYKVILPISRDADGDIELYLRNGFENILKHHNISVQAQWPSAEDVETVVSAASGLFIYATTVIRFVNHLGSLLPQARLQAIINVILDRRKHDPHSGTNVDMPFAELDAFYILILKRIPLEIFPSVHLLLALFQWGSWGVIIATNMLGLSKDEFEAVCNHTSAVVYLQDPGKDLTLDPSVDTSCTYLQINQNVRVKVDDSIREDLGGRVSFYHKSFRDFLLDPVRSGGYCVKGSEALAKRFRQLILDYDRTYHWEGSNSVLAPAVTNSAPLSRPYTNELVNSLITARVYSGFGNEDPQNFSTFGAFGTLGHDRDFRKRLHVVTHLWSPTPLPLSIRLWGCEGRSKLYPGTCIRRFTLAEFNVKEFRLMVRQRKQANVIQRYYPKWYSRIRSLFRNKNQERFESVLYRVGQGEKSIFWYWKIDYESRYYTDLQTINLADGEKRFREEDFEMWDEW